MKLRTSLCRGTGSHPAAANRRHRCAGRWVFDQRRYRFTVIQSKGGDVNQPRDFWVVASLCNHCAAVRMSNENHRSAVRRQNALGHSNVICERYCWILDDADVVAFPLKEFVDVSPTRAIHEATVDENYGLNNRFRYCSHNGFLSRAFVCLVELSSLERIRARLMATWIKVKASIRISGSRPR